MIVCDASAIIDLLLGRPSAAAVARALEGQALAAPELLPVELASTLARLERGGVVSPQAADVALRDVLELPTELIDHRTLLPAAWALRGSVRVADAFYVACAAYLDAPLVTCDGRLARAPVRDATIILIR